MHRILVLRHTDTADDAEVFSVLGLVDVTGLDVREVLDADGAFLLQLLREHGQSVDTGETVRGFAGELVCDEVGEGHHSVLEFLSVHGSLPQFEHSDKSTRRS